MSAKAVLQPEGREVVAAGASPIMRWRWLAAAGLPLAALGLQSVAGHYPQLIERYYSRGIYPSIGRGLAFVSTGFGFSLAEVLLVILLAGLVGGAGWQARRLYLRRVRLGRLLLSGLLHLMWLAGGA